MPQSIVVGSYSVGHSIGHGPTEALRGSEKHFVNGQPVMRVGDSWAPAGTHTDITSVEGSLNVFSNGLARVRTGDGLSCGDHAGDGELTVDVS